MLCMRTLSITYTVALFKLHDLNLIMRKQSYQPKLGAGCKATGLCSSKIVIHDRQRKAAELTGTKTVQRDVTAKGNT